MISDERFFAWLDGELDPAGSAEVEREVAANPKLQHRAEVHRKFGERLHAAFDAITDQPVPEQIRVDAHRGGAEVVDLATRRIHPRAIFRPVQWAAMAATLAVGFIAGSIHNSESASPISTERGELVASGDLEKALYTRLASAPKGAGTRIGLTFLDTSGEVCRTFTEAGSAGLACHQGNHWQIRGLFQTDQGRESEFRMAAGLDPHLAGLVNSTMAGEPFDAAGEHRVLQGLRDSH